MNSRYVLLMGGIILLSMALLMTGCQTPPPKKQDKLSKKTNEKKEKKEKLEKKKDEKKPDKKVVKKESKPEATLNKIVNDRLLAKKQQETFINHLIKTAKNKIANHEYNAAKTFLDQALKINPEHRKAREMRDMVGAFLGERSSRRKSIHKMYETEVKVKIEQAKVEAKNHYKDGLAAIKVKNYDRAIRKFEAALEIIKWAPYQLGLDSLKKQAELKIKEAKDARDEWTKAQQEAKMREAQKRAEQLEAEAQARRATQIRILLSRATEFYTQQKYEKAEAMVKQVIKLDPANKIAVKLRQDIQDASHSYVAKKTLQKRIEQWKRFLEEMKKAAIPVSKHLIFPDKKYWHNVIVKRKNEGKLGRKKNNDVADTPAIRLIKTKLKTVPITLTFTDTPFQDVIRYIQTMAEINIVVDHKIVQKFEIDGRKVNLQLNELKLENALQVLLELNDLIYIFKDDVLFITSKDSEFAQGKAMPMLHDIRDLTGQIKDFPGPRIKLLPSQAGSNQGGGGAQFEEAESTGGAVLTGDKLTELIKASIAPESWAKDEYSIAETSGQLLVVHTEKVQDEISKFLNDMRRFSGMMVAIEARFLEVTDDFLEHIGVDWRGIGNNEMQPNDLNDDADDNRVVMPGVTGGGSSDNEVIDGVNKSNNPSAGAFFRTDAVNRINNYGEATNRGNFDMRLRSEHVDEAALGTRLNPTGGMAVQFATLDDLQLSAVLWLVKKTGRGEVLMAPRLTAFNTQRSNITVVEQRSYIRDFDVEVAQSAYIADPVIGTIQSGVVLDVRPTISNDRKYITLELRPTIARLQLPLTTFETSLGALGKTVTFEIPELELQSVETTVRIPDQGTLMLGGLKTYRNLDRKIDIPVLGNIPIISFFFSQRSKVDEKRDLLILIKAKIIDLEEEEEKAVGINK